MYKKQVNIPKSSTVIPSNKRKPKVSKNKKVLPKETKQSESLERMCPVNEKIHFNNDDKNNSKSRQGVTLYLKCAASLTKFLFSSEQTFLQERSTGMMGMDEGR